ncbi:MAG: hypothetical protein ABGW65_05105 [Marinoscillum sp.]|jgi:hypothetical protein
MLFNNILEDIVTSYNNEVDSLVLLHKTKGGGAVRSKSGLAFENFIESICDINNLVAKRDDYKKSEIIDGEQLVNLQVDKHCYRDGVLVKMIESKCYLDACYFKRAVDDFIDLHNSPDVPNNLDYAIVTGQRALGDNALKYHSAKFKRSTGKDLKIFILNHHKQRNSQKAIYMEEYRSNFNLDMSEVKDLVEWIQK